MTEVWTRERYLAENARLGAVKKAHKFGAKAKLVDGIKFPSTAEANRYVELKLLWMHGGIYELKLQPRFPLLATDGTTAADYVADFQYKEWARADGQAVLITVVEDVKGVLTKVYRLKIKLFRAQYPDLAFREIKAPSRKRRRRKAKPRGK